MGGDETQLPAPDFRVHGSPAAQDGDRPEVRRVLHVGDEVAGSRVRELELRGLQIGPGEDHVAFGEADIREQSDRCVGIRQEARQLDVDAPFLGDEAVVEASGGEPVEQDLHEVILDVLGVDRDEVRRGLAAPESASCTPMRSGSAASISRARLSARAGKSVNRTPAQTSEVAVTMSPPKTAAKMIGARSAPR